MQKTEKPTKNVNQYLIAGWTKQYGRPISLDEVQEINANLSDFVDVMERIDWYLRKRREHKKCSES